MRRDVEWKADGSLDAAGGATMEGECGVRAIEMCETIANVGKADAAGGTLVGRRGQSDARIGDFEDHAAVIAMSRNAELHGCVAGVHAVSQRIFDKGLKDELWNEGRE